MLALHCEELSIVTGSESGLLLPHLRAGDEFDKQEGRKEEDEEEERKPRRAHEISSLLQSQRLTLEIEKEVSWKLGL